MIIAPLRNSCASALTSAKPTKESFSKLDKKIKSFAAAVKDVFAKANKPLQSSVKEIRKKEKGVDTLTDCCACCTTYCEECNECCASVNLLDLLVYHKCTLLFNPCC